MAARQSASTAAVVVTTMPSQLIVMSLAENVTNDDLASFETAQTTRLVVGPWDGRTQSWFGS
jgi:LDH2 family malate/lactate/ureidoglycolate dehydrogenase